MSDVASLLDGLFDSGCRLVKDPRIPAMTSLADELKDDPITGGFVKSASIGVPMPSIPEMGEVWDLWNAAEVQIMEGADPVSTWKKMVSDLEEAIK